MPGLGASYRHRCWGGWLAAIAAVSAMAYFAYRGVFPAVRYMGDFAGYYVSARVWLEGIGSWDQESIWSLGSRWVGPIYSSWNVSHSLPVFLPTDFVGLAAFSWLSWPLAHHAWLLINLVAVLSTVGVALVSLSDRWSVQSGLLLAAGILALAPLHTGFALGNPTIPAGACLMCTHWAAGKKREVLAGLLLSSAIILKPVLAGPFLLYYAAIHRRWKMSLLAGAVVFSCAFIALVRMPSVWDWWRGWTTGTAWSVSPGQINDPTRANFFRYHRIDLYPLMHSFVEDRGLVRLLVGLVFAPFLGSTFYILAKNRNADASSQLLMFGTWGILWLLPIYHKFPDAWILTPVLAWIVGNRQGPQRRWAGAMLIMMLPYMVPGTAVLLRLGSQGRLASTVTSSLWWEAGAMAHQVWMLLGLLGCSLVLLAGSAGRRARGRSPMPGDLAPASSS